MDDCNCAGEYFGPEDPLPTRRRGPDQSSIATPDGLVHPALHGSHRVIAPPVTGEEETPYFAGYPTNVSVGPGEPLSVHVATRSEAPCFVDLYRVTGCADALFAPAVELVERLGEVDPVRYPKLPGGRKLGPGNADSDGCGWPAQSLRSVPESWQSGIYLLQFTAEQEPTGRGSALLGQDAILIVRSRNGAPSSPLLCQVNTGTWAAYHMWHNRSLYMGRAIDGSRFDELRCFTASLQRPGLGMGMPNETLYSPSPPKASYLFAFVDWLQRREVEIDFCAGLDIATEAISLDPYRALFTVGHDEYWTAEQRQRVERFRAGGGHSIFLGGNLAFWEIRANEDGSSIECHKNSGGWKCAAAPEQPGQAEEPLDPEYPAKLGEGRVTSEVWRGNVSSTIPLTGVYFVGRRPDGEEPTQAGAAWWWEEHDGPARPALGFTVCDPDHWVFNGTGLAYGDSFGKEVKLIGHECDGLEVDYGGRVPSLTMEDGALEGTAMLAYADCRSWGELDYSAWPPHREEGRMRSCCAFGGSVTMINREVDGEGMLFAAPVNDWVLALVPSLDWTANRDLESKIRPANETVEAITWNLIEFCLAGSEDG